MSDDDWKDIAEDLEDELADEGADFVFEFSIPKWHWSLDLALATLVAYAIYCQFR